MFIKLRYQVSSQKETDTIKKAKQVNNILKRSCVDENISIISHGSSINPHLHLHLNDWESSRLANNLRNFLSDTELE